MPLALNERKKRQALEAIYDPEMATPAEDVDEIREAALAEFTVQLDGKLKNLQQGESIAIRFRFDIIQTNGKVRGGSGSERNMPAYVEWRKAVYERDNWTCQECGAQGTLNAHHIQAWSSHPERRFDVSNGVTLCRECHAKKHPHIGWLSHG